MNAAISAHQRDDLEGAENYLKSALPEAERLGAQDRRLAETHAALGTIYFDQGRAEEAKASLEQAQAIFDVVLGPQETRLASNLNALGLVYGQLAEDDAAISAFERAAVIYEQALGPDHTTLSRVLENHAGLLLQAARYDEAKLIFPRVLSIREKELGVRSIPISCPCWTATHSPCACLAMPQAPRPSIGELRTSCPDGKTDWLSSAAAVC